MLQIMTKKDLRLLPAVNNFPINLDEMFLYSLLLNYCLN
jgi:hypothetical protein